MNNSLYVKRSFMFPLDLKHQYDFAIQWTRCTYNVSVQSLFIGLDFLVC